MNVQDAFEVLGIEQTKEEGRIRAAYLERLKSVNPEDDAEGFKQLRAAYERALAFVNEPEEGEEIREAEWMEESGPAGDFFRRLSAVYANLPRRLEAAEWGELLQSEALDSLEDAERVKWGLFSYLADHFRLPCPIWRQFDQTFFIRENAQEFKEHLPAEFVDFMIYKIEDESGSSEFPFEDFRGEPEADYDGFLENYIQLIRIEDGSGPNALKEKARLLKALEETGIYHPWAALEKAEYLQKTGAKEEAKQLARRLLEENGGDEKVRLTGAGILDGCGCAEEAHAIFSQYLEQEEKTEWGGYMAHYGLAKQAADRGDWEKAIEEVRQARDYRDTPEIRELMVQTDQELVQVYTQREQELTPEEVHRLTWAYIDTRRYEEGRDFLERHPEYREDTAAGHKRAAVLYLMTEEYEKALEESAQWKKCMEQEEEQDKEQEKEQDKEQSQGERKWNLAQCLNLEGRALRALYCQEKEKNGPDSEQAVKLAADSMQALEKAAELSPEESDFALHKILLLRDMQEWEKVVADCEKLLEQDENFFWACYYMQEAYEALRMAQEVIDTFYRAKQIYAGHPDIYERALKVFKAYRQWQDALGIIRQAEEADAASWQVRIDKIGVLEELVENEEDWQQADDYAAWVIGELEKEEASGTLLAEAYLKRAYLNDSGDKYTKTKGQGLDRVYVEKSLELQENVWARYYLGRYYKLYGNDAKEAYRLLKQCEEAGMTYEWMYFFIARCHEAFQEWNDAIAYYKKTAEVNPEADDCYWRIAWLYRQKLYRTEQREYADLSMYYENLQAEKFGETVSTFRWRATIYQHLGEYDKTLEELEKALEKESDSGLLLRKGNTLLLVGRYEEAVACMEQSLEAEDRYGEDDCFCCDKIAQCFYRTRKLQEGIAWFEDRQERLKTQEQKYRDMGVEIEELRKKCMDILSVMEAESGNIDAALKWLKEKFGSLDMGRVLDGDWGKTADLLSYMRDIWIDYQPYVKKDILKTIRPVAELAEKAVADEKSDKNDRASYLSGAADLYFYLGEYDDAQYYAEKALALADEDCEELKSIKRTLMECRYWKGDREGALRYGEMFRKELAKIYEECTDLELPPEELIARPGALDRRELYSWFAYVYFTGQYDKARACCEQIEKQDKCWWCSSSGCFEVWNTKGLIDYLDGRMEEAVKHFERANAECTTGGSLYAGMMLRKIEREMAEHDNRD